MSTVQSFDTQIFVSKVLRIISSVRYDVGYANLSRDEIYLTDDTPREVAIDLIRHLKMGVVVNTDTQDITIIWGYMLTDDMHSRRMRFGNRWLAPM